MIDTFQYLLLVVLYLDKRVVQITYINHPYYFQLKGDEDMDFWFKRIIDVFKALSMHKSFKPIEIKKNKPTLNYFDWVYNDNL